MSLINTVKQKIIFILLILSIIISVSFLLINLISQPNRYTFKTKDTNFSVTIPDKWSVIEEPRYPAGDGIELSPDEGIKLLLDGNEDNYIRIYSQFGTLNPPSDNFIKEEFTTNKGINVILYKDNESNSYWYVLLNQDIAPNFFGAIVSFKENDLLSQKEKQVLNILKSIEIESP